MKLTTKHIMFILMCVLLALVIVMAGIVLRRVSGFLQLGGIGKPSSSESASTPASDIPQESSSEPSSSVEATESTAPHVHEFYKDKKVSATCDTQGYTLYGCSCGRSDIRDFTEPLGHNYGEKTTVAATCTTDGWTERTCSRCKKVERTNIVTAAHKFSEWKNIDVATGEATQEQRTCSVCKTIEIRSLDTTKTWVIRKSPLDAAGEYSHYQIVADLKDTDKDLTFELYTALADKTIGLDYNGSRVVVSYKIAGEEHTYSVSTGTNILTIDVDGTTSNTKPVITEPSDPDNDPAGGTDQPDGDPTDGTDQSDDSQSENQPNPDPDPENDPTGEVNN